MVIWSFRKYKLRQAECVALVRSRRENGQQTLGFTSRPFVLCGLPLRRPPVGQLKHERRNGRFTLQVVGHPDFGLPFGQDRLVPIFLATLAVRQKSPVVRFSGGQEVPATPASDRADARGDRDVTYVLEHFIENADALVPDAPNCASGMRLSSRRTERLPQFVVHFVSKTPGHILVSVNHVPGNVCRFGRLPFRALERALNDPTVRPAVLAASRKQRPRTISSCVCFTIKASTC